MVWQLGGALRAGSKSGRLAKYGLLDCASNGTFRQRQQTQQCNKRVLLFKASYQRIP